MSRVALTLKIVTTKSTTRELLVEKKGEDPGEVRQPHHVASHSFPGPCVLLGK